MVNRFSFGVGLLLAAPLLSASSTWAADEVQVEPSSSWSMEYTPDSCLLKRTFGSGEEQVLLQFDQFDPARPPTILVSGKQFGQFSTATARVIATFGPGLQEGESAEAVVGTLGPERTPLLMLGKRDLLNRSSLGSTPEFAAPTSEQVAAVTQLRLDAGSVRLMLKRGSLGAPLKAMKTCLDALVRDWGFDPEQQASLTKRVTPTGQPGLWMTSRDYPKRAIAKGERGTVRFRIMVGADGVPTQCFIPRTTMSPDFITLTCDLLMKRARFSSALDREGRPVASYYVNTVHWVPPQ